MQDASNVNFVGSQQYVCIQIKSNQIYFEAQNMKETKQMKNKK